MVASDRRKRDLITGDPETERIVKGLNVIRQNASLYRLILAIKGQNAQTLLDAFQTLLDGGGFDVYRGDLVVAMLRLSKSTNLYPQSFNLHGVELESDDPAAAGGFADIYKGSFSGRAVCVKMIRLYEPSQVDFLQKAFSKEAILWRQLIHPNLLPFIGLCRIRSGLCFVSPWASNGHVVNYLRQNPTANRHLLCLDVAHGLQYLHDNNIIHGDLKGANILVNDSGRACVADFGLSSVTDPHILHWTSLSSIASKGGTARWQAPELHDAREDKITHNTAESDVYAWACVCYEIFTGLIPFYECLRDAVVISTVAAGGKPTCPLKSNTAWTNWGLTDDMWNLMHECWDQQAAARPKINNIVAWLWVGDPDERPSASWADAVIRSMDTSSYPKACEIIENIIYGYPPRVTTYEVVQPKAEERFFSRKKKWPYIVLLVVILSLAAVVAGTVSARAKGNTDDVSQQAPAPQGTAQVGAVPTGNA